MSRRELLHTAASTSTGNYAIPNLPGGHLHVQRESKRASSDVRSHQSGPCGGTSPEGRDVALQIGSGPPILLPCPGRIVSAQDGERRNGAQRHSQGNGTSCLSCVITGRLPESVRATLTTLPGSAGAGTGGGVVMNGLGGNGTNAAYRIEGQDSSNRVFNLTEYPGMSQPNVDAIQEISYQTSNYAPEFGQGGGMVVNMTMKSGTNQYHGTGFEYFVNEDLNAGYPFSISGGPGSTTGGDGGKFRPRYRRNDFGGTLGGPLIIPKLYNGKDKTFFQWSYEQFGYNQLFTFNDTVPTPAFRAGDFSAISPNGSCSLCAAYQIPTGPLGGSGSVDALNRPMLANVVYDPLTRGTLANGLQYANPFPHNMIPSSRFNQTALAMQALFPNPNPGNTNLASNYTGSINGGQYSAIPTLKIDQNISSKDKLSFYWSRNNVETQINTGPFAADGLPLEIGQYRGGLIPTNTWRLNYDRTLTPTLLFHFGVGYMDTIFNDQAPFLSFNPDQFGLTGFIQHRQFPSVTGMQAPTPTVPAGGATPPGAAFGGMQNIGTSGQLQSWIHEERPTLNANATWVKGAHRFKAGAEYEIEGVIGYNADLSGVTLTTGVGPTSQPFQPAVNFNGYTQGFGYASFLLGDFTSINQTPNFVGVRNGYQQWGLFAQDSWKIGRKADGGIMACAGITPLPSGKGARAAGADRPDDGAIRMPAGALGASSVRRHVQMRLLQADLSLRFPGPGWASLTKSTPKPCSEGGGESVISTWPDLPATYSLPRAALLIAPQPNNAQVHQRCDSGIHRSAAAIPDNEPICTGCRFRAPRAVLPGGYERRVCARRESETRPPRVNQFTIGFQREITS